MTNRCIECENENLLKVADLEIENYNLKSYNKLLESALDTKDDLCRALREDNEKLRSKLEVLNDRR